MSEMQNSPTHKGDYQSSLFSKADEVSIQSRFPLNEQISWENLKTNSRPKVKDVYHKPSNILWIYIQHNIVSSHQCVTNVIIFLGLYHRKVGKDL